MQKKDKMGNRNSLKVQKITNLHVYPENSKKNAS